MSNTANNRPGRRGGSSVSLFFIWALVFSITGCSNDQNQIAKTVDGFFSSLSSKDTDALVEYFPAFAGLDVAEQNAYLEVFSNFTRWKLEDVTIDGINAVAAVLATSDIGELPLRLPLTYRKKSWVVTETTSMQINVGTVPAE